MAEITLIKKTNKPAKAAGTEHLRGYLRFELADRALRWLQCQQDGLIEILDTAQEAFGYLSEALLIYPAHPLKLSPSWAYVPLQALNPEGELVDEVIRD